jgi:hypothetical protein
VEVEFDLETGNLPHPNTMDLFAYRDGRPIGALRVMSVGGGAIKVEGRTDTDTPEVYAEKSFAEIAEYCKHRNLRLSDYVERMEGPEIWDYLYKVWQTMKAPPWTRGCPSPASCPAACMWSARPSTFIISATSTNPPPPGKTA